MAVTRIKNNQITDKTITYAKIADYTLTGGQFANSVTFNGDIVVSGNLSVMGATATISATNTFVNDPIIVFNNGFTGAPTSDVGILVNRDLTDGYNTAWVWNEGSQAFEGVRTTDTGGNTGVLANISWVNVVVGNLIAKTSANIGNLTFANHTVSSIDGTIAVANNVLPSVNNTLDLGASGTEFANVFAHTLNLGGATITTSGGNLNLTPNGGVTTIANLSIAGGTLSGTFTGDFTGNVTSSNVSITGGSITGTPISGGTGSFTTLQTSANTTLGGALVTVSAIENITNSTQSYTPADGALVVTGGVGVGKDVNIGGNLTVAQKSTLGNIVVQNNSISSTGNVAISATGAVKIGALTMPQTDGAAGSFMMSDGAGNITLVPAGTAASGNVIPLGTPTVGTLVDNSPAIITFTTATKVTDAVDQLNEILGKLVPPQPPVFPNATTLTIAGLSSGLRMANAVQTDNTLSGSHSLSGGSTVSAYKRAASYTTNVINDVGPGSSGNVQVIKNGTVSGSHVIVQSFAGANNGTYGELVISDNADYGTKTSTALNFWTSFDAEASGTVPAGWNEVQMTDTSGTATNTPVWYYDASAPGTPVVVSTSFAPSSPVTAFSSNVPHYTSATVWTGAGTATRLSGDLYPATDTFLTGTAGGSFAAPTSVTYAGAGVTTPLARNLYVASGNAVFSTTVNTLNVTGSSSAGPSYSVANSYATGVGSASPGGTVLTINTSDAVTVNENDVTVGTFGTGGAATAVRIGGLATGATPTLSGMAAWVSSAALPTYEAAVVAGIASCNTTNYSTGYFPVGPNLSGQDATQYLTLRITRDAVSKFDVKFSGKVSGCHIAMPGSSLGTTAAPTNGWIDATTAYSGAGVPGTGTGGNGSAGCALGGTLTTGATVTNLSTTVTFGTESSYNSTSYYIYVRFTLATGDSITALSFANPTH